MKKQSMFENYPDVVEVDDLRKMLGGNQQEIGLQITIRSGNSECTCRQNL